MIFPVEGQKQDAVPAKLEWVTPKFLPLLGEETDGTKTTYHTEININMGPS